jgi:hypothetical protein
MTTKTNRITVRHIDADTNPMKALKYAEAWREGMMVRVRLVTQNTRTERSWTCATAEATRRVWIDALDVLGYDAADQHQTDMIETIIEGHLS